MKHVAIATDYLMVSYGTREAWCIQDYVEPHPSHFNMWNKAER